jgi:hypothetical protein
VTGYDDGDEVFHVVHAAPVPADPLLYTNLGRKRVPWLVYQVFLGCGAPDPDLRDGVLRYSRSEWSDGYHPGLSDVSTFGPYYATGAAAYEALRAALDGDGAGPPVPPERARAEPRAPPPYCVPRQA